jgi:hypothetical protein
LTRHISRIKGAKNLKNLPLNLNGLDVMWYFFHIF